MGSTFIVVALFSPPTADKSPMILVSPHFLPAISIFIFALFLSDAIVYDICFISAIESFSILHFKELESNSAEILDGLFGI